LKENGVNTAKNEKNAKPQNKGELSKKEWDKS